MKDIETLLKEIEARNSQWTRQNQGAHNPDVSRLVEALRKYISEVRPEISRYNQKLLDEVTRILEGEQPLTTRESLAAIGKMMEERK